MTTRLRRFHRLAPGSFAGEASVQLELAGGAMVGITDSRFPSPTVSSLSTQWPALIYANDLKPGLNTGERLTPDLAARLNAKIDIDSSDETGIFPKALPDALRVETPIISQKMRETIEAVEPDRHQFFPISFRSSRTGEMLYEDQAFHYWNILNWIAPDLLYDLEAMDGAPHIETITVRGPGDPPLGFKEPPVLTHVSIQNWNFRTWLIRPEWVGIGHAFRTGSYSRSRLFSVSASAAVFISDELRAALSRALPEGSFESTPIDISS